MVPPSDANEIFVEQWLQTKPFRRVRKNPQRQVEAVCVQQFEREILFNKAEPQVDRRRFFGQKRCQTREDDHGGVIATADVKDAPRRFRVEGGLRLQRRTQLSQCLADLHLKLHRPHGRQHHPARSDEQLVLKKRTKAPEGAAHRGLAHAHTGCSRGYAALSHQRLERHHQIEVDPLQIHRADIRYPLGLLEISRGRRT